MGSVELHALQGPIYCIGATQEALQYLPWEAAIKLKPKNLKQQLNLKQAVASVKSV